MFGGNWSRASGDIKYLTCEVISQSYVFEESSNFMNGSFSWYVTILPSLVAIGIALAEMSLISRVIKQDHMIKGSCDYNKMLWF